MAEAEGIQVNSAISPDEVRSAMGLEAGPLPWVTLQLPRRRLVWLPWRKRKYRT